MISLHAYYQPVGDDMQSFLACAEDMDQFIDSVVAIADSVRAERHAGKRIMVAFDEWNVWYQNAAPSVLPAGDDWPVAPRLLEDTYNIADAVVVGNLLVSLLRHSDRVTAACQAQLVNVIAPIMTEPGGPAWRQTIFHPFALTARHAKGTVLRTEPVSPTYETARYGAVPVLDTVALHDDDAGHVALFAVNRSPEVLELRVDLRAMPGLTPAGHVAIEAGIDPEAVNTAQDPDRVVPRRRPRPRLDGTAITALLPAMSWNLIQLNAKGA
jgi:alpha-N-arabinofuranosidase